MVCMDGTDAMLLSHHVNMSAVLVKGDVEEHAALLGLHTGGLKPELIDQILKAYQQVCQAYLCHVTAWLSLFPDQR